MTRCKLVRLSMVLMGLIGVSLFLEVFASEDGQEIIAPKKKLNSTEIAFVPDSVETPIAEKIPAVDKRVSSTEKSASNKEDIEKPDYSEIRLKQVMEVPIRSKRMAINKENGMIAISDNNSIYLYNSNYTLRATSHRQPGIQVLSFMPNGDLAAVVREYSTCAGVRDADFVHIYSSESLELKSKFEFPTRSFVNGGLVVDKNDHVIIGTTGIDFYKRNGDLRTEIHTHSPQINALAMDLNGNLLQADNRPVGKGLICNVKRYNMSGDLLQELNLGHHLVDSLAVDDWGQIIAKSLSSLDFLDKNGALIKSYDTSLVKVEDWGYFLDVAVAPGGKVMCMAHQKDKSVLFHILPKNR